MEKEPQKEKGAIARIVKWWFLLTAGTFASLIISVASVLYDWEDALVLFALLSIFFLIVQGIFLLMALFTRQWGHAIGIFCGIIASLVLSVFCIVLVGAGQHHPPKFNDEDMIVEDSLEVVSDSRMPNVR